MLNVCKKWYKRPHSSRCVARFKPPANGFLIFEIQIFAALLLWMFAILVCLLTFDA